MGDDRVYQRQSVNVRTRPGGSLCDDDEQVAQVDFKNEAETCCVLRASSRCRCAHNASALKPLQAMQAQPQYRKSIPMRPHWPVNR